jgi:hypothetical protein
MGVLIIAATVALVVLIIQRAGGAAGGAAGVSTDLALRQPAGSRIGQIAVLDGRLAVWVTRPDGDRILLLDGRTGRQTGEIRLGE